MKWKKNCTCLIYKGKKPISKMCFLVYNEVVLCVFLIKTSRTSQKSSIEWMTSGFTLIMQ